MITKNLLLACLLSISAAAFAQVQPVIQDEWISKGNKDQQDKFKAGDYAYPARPRNMWQIGLNLGLPQIAGDVRIEPFGGNHGPAFGVGLNVRKGIGYVASIRLHGMYGKTYGQSYVTGSFKENKTLNGSFANSTKPDADKYSTGADYTNNSWVPNFQTTVFHGSLDLLFNLNNINFHNATPKWYLYAFVGVGGFVYETKMDALDANNAEYDYLTLLSGLQSNDNKTERLDAIHGALDGTYETQGEVANSVKFGDNKTKVLDPSISVGMGISRKIGARCEIGLEHRMSEYFDDLADGYRYDASGDFTPHYDVFHYTQITFGVNLGKDSKNDIPAWEKNPLNTVYEKLAALDPANLLKDSDNDGVIDQLDKEPGTAEGTPVDTHGVALDSDKDGCKDFEDPEPFSTPNLPIENCQNVRKDGGVTETQVQTMINKAINDLGSVGNTYLPWIYFDLNKSNIRATEVPALEHIAEIMKANGKLKLEVIGNTDVRASEAYNMKLSENRAKEAINYLVTKKGIDQSRFIMKYNGEAAPIIVNAGTETEHQQNRRVEFHIASTK